MSGKAAHRTQRSMSGSRQAGGVRGRVTPQERIPHVRPGGLRNHRRCGYRGCCREQPLAF